jgi:hypothetical protein
MEGSLVAYKVFTNGSTLQASELNENLMQQSIATFSNAAARTAAITSPVEGQMTYLLDVDRYEHWNSSAWVSPFGLTLVKAQTIGSGVSSVTITDCFNSTYDDYKVLISGATATGSGPISLQLTGTSSGYYGNLIFSGNFGGTPSSFGMNNVSSHQRAGTVRDGVYLNLDIINPFLARPTHFAGGFQDVDAGFSKVAHAPSTSTTGFTLTVTGGTITGGKLIVYGYRKA